MKEGRASWTAAIVALSRGVGLDDRRRDELAATFAPPALGAVLHRMDGRPLLRGLARIATAGLIDHATLRMAAIDEAVAGAVERGCTELVILGAGMDARAWRMGALSGVDVFEVDHPSTQAVKRERAGGHAPLSRSHTFVPVDFERDDLGERLADAGHDPARPTVWIWEGVTMYLQPEAMDATIGEVAARSARGSELVVTYVTPDLVGPLLTNVVQAAFVVLGEPLHGFVASDVLAEHLSVAGFEVEDDSCSRDWAERHGFERAPPRRVARRAPPPRRSPALSGVRHGSYRPPSHILRGHPDRRSVEHDAGRVPRAARRNADATCSPSAHGYNSPSVSCCSRATGARNLMDPSSSSSVHAFTERGRRGCSPVRRPARASACAHLRARPGSRDGSSTRCRTSTPTR